MAQEMRFTIPGEPCGKCRPRVVHNGNFSRAYTPEKTVNYETLAKLEFQRQCGGYIDGVAVRMEIIARFSIPKSTSKRKARAMEAGEIYPAKKPDCDNIIKIVCDALNGIAYKDDAQIIAVSLEKRYAQIPGVDVRIMEAV